MLDLGVEKYNTEIPSKVDWMNHCIGIDKQRGRLGKDIQIFNLRKNNLLVYQHIDIFNWIVTYHGEINDKTVMK